MIELGENIGDEYVKPPGYVIVPMGNLTGQELPTDEPIEIPEYVY